MNILLRMTFVYCLLYFLPERPYFYHDVVFWTARNIFRFHGVISMLPHGSGDRLYDFFSMATIFVIALVVGLVWSVCSRKKSEDNRAVLYWLVWYLRVALGIVMIRYGIVKIYPSQFPAPSLMQLMSIYAESRPQELLWAFVGASPGYGMFAGVVEVAGGVLLMLPYVWLVGALVALVAMGNVFIFNLCYDVPVKSFSLSLLLASVFIVCSQGFKLFDFFIRGKFVRLELEPGFFKRKILNRAVIGLQILVLVFFVLQTSERVRIRMEPKATVPLHGIWYVSEAHGVEMFPWTHFIFEFPKWLALKHRDGSIEMLDIEGMTADSLPIRKKTLSRQTVFKIEASGPEAMTLRGDWEGRPLELKLQKVDDALFPLKKPGIHLISEAPERN